MTLASVIVPSHADGGTLGPALASVLGQTVADIEALVVLDGAVPDTVERARTIAADDPRVRVLSHPKGPGRGHGHRHEAVLAAVGCRIFFLDDDDLWLPDHVERHLSAEDAHRAAVVTSTVASITPSDRVEIAVVDHSAGLMREVTDRFLDLYDTHLSILATAYRGLDRPLFSDAQDRGGPRHLVRTIALSHQLVWAHVPQVTALSFHGTPRESMGIPRSERLRQLEAWAALDVEAVRRRVRDGSVIAHLMGLLHAVEPGVDEEVGDYLARVSGRDDPTCRWVGLSPEQLRRAEMVLEFYRELRAGRFTSATLRSYARSDREELLISLSETVTGPPPATSQIRSVWRRLLGLD